MVELTTESLFQAMPTASDVEGWGLNGPTALKGMGQDTNLVIEFDSIDSEFEEIVFLDKNWTSVKPPECEPIQEFNYPKMTDEPILVSSFGFENLASESKMDYRLAGIAHIWPNEETAQSRFQKLRSTLETVAETCEVYTVLREDGSTYEAYRFQSNALAVGDNQVESFGNPAKSAWFVLGQTGTATYGAVLGVFSLEPGKKVKRIGKEMAAWLHESLTSAHQPAEP